MLTRYALFGTTLVAVSLASSSRAADYDFSTIHYSDATASQARAINASGEIVGWYQDGTNRRGYRRTASGAFSPITAPAAFTTTFAFGINDTGTIVGDYNANGGNRTAYAFDGTTFTSFAASGATVTSAVGINNAGQIAGFENGSGVERAFVRQTDSTLTTLAIPNASKSFAHAINDVGQVAGWWFDASNVGRGYVLDLETDAFTSLVFPGASQTAAFGINDSGDVVGFYDAAGARHGFLYSGGTYSTFDFAGATESSAIGINDAGAIVGLYNGILTRRGYVATAVPEPASMGLLGFAAVGLLRRRRRAGLHETDPRILR